MKFLIVIGMCLAVSSASVVPLSSQRSVEFPILDIEGRIINGAIASEGQFKYQAGLLLIGYNNLHSWCGGVLISREWVLSAAHCTESVASGTVILGSTDRTKATETREITDKDIINHPNWYKPTYDNDISLIKLTRSVSLSSHIQVVTLPPYGSRFQYIGEAVITSGWGKTTDAVNEITQHLLFANQVISPDDVCSKVYGSHVYDNKNICIDTKINRQSACKGDSGGPLVLKSSNVLVGLTSYFPSPGCEQGYPIVFTRITSFTDWIYKTSGVRN